jgi:hypothetical protein
MPSKKRAKKRNKPARKKASSTKSSTRKSLTLKKRPRSAPKASSKAKRGATLRRSAARVRLSPEESQAQRRRGSGDSQDLSVLPIAASESVEELAEEGNAFEAGIVEGVENSPDADRGGVRTREVPEDDVPEEYLDENQ